MNYKGKKRPMSLQGQFLFLMKNKVYLSMESDLSENAISSIYPG